MRQIRLFNSKFVKKNVYSYNPLSYHKKGIAKARAWQVRAFEKLKDHTFALIQAPMGAGKSLLLMLLAYSKWKSKQVTKIIILVPQTIIGQGYDINKTFDDPILNLGVGFKLRPDYNACRSKKEDKQNPSAKIIDFLKSKNSKEFEQCVAICTYVTFNTVYKNYKKYFKNMLIVVDESHHILSSNEERDMNNQLGRSFKELFDQRTKNNLQFIAATATFFRGDGQDILHDEIASHITDDNSIALPYDVHLSSCKYLKAFTMDFITYKTPSEKVNSLSTIFNKGDVNDQTKFAKTICYIEKTNGNESADNTKMISVNQVYAAISCEDRPRIVDDAKSAKKHKVDTWRPGIVMVYSKKWKRYINIVDLVTNDSSHRHSAKKVLNDMRQDTFEQEIGNDIDMVLALDMMKEGADWVEASRSIILGKRGSRTDLVQMVGRLFRDFPGKEVVEVIQMFQLTGNLNEDKATRNLQMYLDAILCAMILQEITVSMDGTLKNVKRAVSSKEYERLRDVLVRPDVRMAVVNAMSDVDIDYGENKQIEGEKLITQAVLSVLKKYNVELPESKLERVANLLYKDQNRKWTKNTQLCLAMLSKVDKKYLKSIRKEMKDAMIKLNAVQGFQYVTSAIYINASTFDELRSAQGKPLFEKDILFSLEAIKKAVRVGFIK